MTTPDNGGPKLDLIVLAESDRALRDDLRRLLGRLARRVELFDDGEEALYACRSQRPGMAVISLSCWTDPQEALDGLRATLPRVPGPLVVTFRKILPRQLGALARMGVEHVFGQPFDPLHLFRLANQRFGVIARRYDRVRCHLTVFWGAGPLREVVGCTRDLSRGGMLLVSDKVLTRGSSLFFGVQLDPTTAIELRGEVVGVDAVTHRPAFSYGVSFNDLRSTTAAVLEEAVAQLAESGAPAVPVLPSDTPRRPSQERLAPSGP